MTSARLYRTCAFVYAAADGIAAIAMLADAYVGIGMEGRFVVVAARDKRLTPA